MKLTKRIIDGLRYDGKPDGSSQCIAWDSELKGFGVRCFATGLKSFVLWYRSKGTRRRVTLGQYPPMTPDEARRKARSVLGQVGMGSDPIEEQEKVRESCTVAALCKSFMQDHSRVHKKSWKGDQEQIDKYIIPTFRNKRARDIERGDIIRLHNRVGAQYPYRANRLLALLSTLFEFGRRTGLLPEEKSNPARGIRRFKEERRTRYIQESEMSALLEAIDGEESPYLRALFRLYLMTGCRRNELLTLRWEHVDLNRGEICIVNPKNSETRFLPVSEIIVGILRNLPHEEGNQFVFPSPTRPGCHYVELKGAWKRIKKRSGLTDCRLHDLRRTCASWLVSGGTPLLVVSKLLGHKSPSVTASTYAHLSQSPIAEASRNMIDKVVSFERIKKEKESNEKAG